MSISPQITEQARSTDADVRQKAALQVSLTMKAEDLPLMYELLGDKDWRVRKTIVDGFLRNPTDDVIRGLIEARRDPENAGKRTSATEALSVPQRCRTRAR